jgi:hypothetical protein
MPLGRPALAFGAIGIKPERQIDVQEIEDPAGKGWRLRAQPSMPLLAADRRARQPVAARCLEPFATNRALQSHVTDSSIRNTTFERSRRTLAKPACSIPSS